MGKGRVARPLYFGLGLVFVALGYVGAILPIMPSTVFFLMALWAFQRSSPKFEDWLLNKSFIGPTLRDWTENRVVRPRAKVTAIATIFITMIASSAVLVAKGKSIYIPVAMLTIGFLVSWYIATRPSGEPPKVAPEAV